MIFANADLQIIGLSEGKARQWIVEHEYTGPVKVKLDNGVWYECTKMFAETWAAELDFRAYPPDSLPHWADAHPFLDKYAAAAAEEYWKQAWGMRVHS